MENKKILEKLNAISEELDYLQEENIFQDSKDLINELGEAIGIIDNIIESLENK